MSGVDPTANSGVVNWFKNFLGLNNTGDSGGKCMGEPGSLVKDQTDTGILVQRNDSGVYNTDQGTVVISPKTTITTLGGSAKRLQESQSIPLQSIGFQHAPDIHTHDLNLKLFFANETIRLPKSVLQGLIRSSSTYLPIDLDKLEDSEFNKLSQTVHKVIAANFKGTSGLVDFTPVAPLASNLKMVDTVVKMEGKDVAVYYYIKDPKVASHLPTYTATFSLKDLLHSDNKKSQVICSYHDVNTASCSHQITADKPDINMVDQAFMAAASIDQDSFSVEIKPSIFVDISSATIGSNPKYIYYYGAIKFEAKFTPKSTQQDAGLTEAGVKSDAMVTKDLGARPETGTSSDQGPIVDAGVAPDTGTQPDSSISADK